MESTNNVRYTKECDNVYYLESGLNKDYESFDYNYEQAYENIHNVKESVYHFMKCVEAIKNIECIQDITLLNKIYDVYINLGIKHDKKYFKLAIEQMPERAEAYYIYGNAILSENGNMHEAYILLKTGKGVGFENAIKKYGNVCNERYYGLHMNEILSTVCYNLRKYKEAIELLNELSINAEFKHLHEKINHNVKLLKELI